MLLTSNTCCFYPIFTSQLHINLHEPARTIFFKIDMRIGETEKRQKRESIHPVVCFSFAIPRNRNSNQNRDSATWAITASQNLHQREARVRNQTCTLMWDVGVLILKSNVHENPFLFLFFCLFVCLFYQVIFFLMLKSSKIFNYSLDKIPVQMWLCVVLCELALAFSPIALATLFSLSFQIVSHWPFCLSCHPAGVSLSQISAQAAPSHLPGRLSSQTGWLQIIHHISEDFVHSSLLKQAPCNSPLTYFSS